MSYRFKRHEPLARGFGRVARELLAGVLADLGADSGASPSGEGIHDARRKLKKLRTLLRMMRPALGEEGFRQRNSEAREAGRSLSPARDATVQLATLDGLLDVCAQREVEKLSPMRRQMVDERARLDLAQRDAASLDAVIVRLRALLDDIKEAAVDDDAELVCESLRRAYRRGRRAFAAAKVEATDETLHTLRKRVKDLHHQLMLVRRAAPERCKRLRRQLDNLGDRLGLDHDHAVLAKVLAPGPAIDAEALLNLRDRLDRKRCKLQRGALRLAEEVFERKPSTWLKPFARAWKRWHDPR